MFNLYNNPLQRIITQCYRHLSTILLNASFKVELMGTVSEIYILLFNCKIEKKNLNYAKLNL